MPGRRGQLASPADVVAAPSEATGDPASVAFETRAWPELQLVSMRLLAPGACVVARAAEAGTPAHFAQPSLVESIATAMALRLLAFHSTQRPRERVAPAGLSSAAYARVLAFVEEHLGARVSLEELAAVAGVSRFHFARQFRLRTGQSPMAFVLRARVERSKALLRAGKATVGEVAAALGFADQSHFTRTFRRFVGTTPGAFSGHARGPAGAVTSPHAVPAAPLGEE